MATRQYVGARYVPKFATPTEWNAGMTYEALTIVTYMNASYTSKIPVPAGIVPTNETYWALTGNYNAQVEQYRQEVEQVKNDITTLTNTTDENFAFDRGTLMQLNGKKILIVGDSISDETHPSASPNWVTLMKQKLNGICTITNNSGSGRTLSGANGGADILGTITEPYDYIIIFLGVNDCATSVPIGSVNDTQYTSFNGALTVLNNNIQQNNPNSIVFYISPMKATLSPTNKFNILDVFRSIIYYRSMQFGFHYIDGHNVPLLNPTNDFARNRWQPDGLHPITAYSPYLCDFIISSLIKKGSDSLVIQKNSFDIRELAVEGVTANNAVLYYTSGGGFCVGFNLTATIPSANTNVPLISGLPEWCYPNPNTVTFGLLTESTGTNHICTFSYYLDAENKIAFQYTPSEGMPTEGQVTFSGMMCVENIINMYPVYPVIS